MGSKVFVAASLVVAGIALAWIAVGSMGSNLIYYWTPTDLLEAGDDAKGATVRLAGMVKEKSIEWDKGTKILEFTVHDGTNEVRVRGTGMPPAMFREKIGVVVQGTMGADGVFESSRLLVKHDNEYRAPEDPKEVDVQKLWESLDAGES